MKKINVRCENEDKIIREVKDKSELRNRKLLTGVNMQREETKSTNKSVNIKNSSFKSVSTIIS